MPLYEFQCTNDNCGQLEEVMGQMSSPPQPGTCSCGAAQQRLYGARKFVFNPYVEHNLGDDPVEFTSTRQRDGLLAKHHLTYDSARYMTRKPKPGKNSAIHDLTFAQVERELERGPR